jgi:NAD+ synthase
MPERESSHEALRLALLLAESLGIRAVVNDITAVLEAAGSYRLRDDAIRMVAPCYGPNQRCKLVRTAADYDSPYFIPSVIIEDSNGKAEKVRLNKVSYLQVVAATNFKQRVRKMIEYCQADQLQFAVAGTPNRLEYDQGFFVKGGDGLADLKPIAHLYKSQVYELADHLEIPTEIQMRPSTTDTFPLFQTQEEFYFGVPLRSLDLCLYAYNNGLSTEVTANAVGLPHLAVSSIFARIEANRRTTSYLHERTFFVEPVDLSS